MRHSPAPEINLQFFISNSNHFPWICPFLVINFNITISCNNPELTIVPPPPPGLNSVPFISKSYDKFDVHANIRFLEFKHDTTG